MNRLTDEQLQRWAERPEVLYGGALTSGCVLKISSLAAECLEARAEIAEMEKIAKDCDFEINRVLWWAYLSSNPHFRRYESCCPCDECTKVKTDYAEWKKTNADQNKGRMARVAIERMGDLLHREVDRLTASNTALRAQVSEAREVAANILRQRQSLYWTDTHVLDAAEDKLRRLAGQEGI